MCAGTMRESREERRETTRQTVSRFLKIADESIDNRRLRFVCLIQTLKSWGVISWYLCTLQRPSRVTTCVYTRGSICTDLQTRIAYYVQRSRRTHERMRISMKIEFGGSLFSFRITHVWRLHVSALLSNCAFLSRWRCLISITDVCCFRRSLLLPLSVCPITSHQP